MAIELLTQSSATNLVALGRAALETLAYSDVFDYPLRVEEVHRYLSIPATLGELNDALERRRDLAASNDGFYFLKGRAALVPLRLKREEISRPALQTRHWFRPIAGSAAVHPHGCLDRFPSDVEFRSHSGFRLHVGCQAWTRLDGARLRAPLWKAHAPSLATRYARI